MLKTLAIRDFRNYEEAHIELSAGLNLVYGQNAQGKTNLLEAIALISTAQLLRGHRDAEAIRHGCEEARIRGELVEHSTTVEVQLRRGVRKRALLNDMGLSRAADLLGRLPTVTFTTRDLEVLRGEPSERRLFVDLALSQLSAGYLRHLAHYRRAVDQRNALLKMAQEQTVESESFEVWEAELCEHGAALRELRHDYVRRLAGEATGFHRQLANGEILGVVYMPKDPGATPDELSAAYRHHRCVEIHRGATQIGPHRDDIYFTINELEIKLYGSQGQQRSAMIALKMAGLAVARQILRASPILLLDDIFSDLDKHRRSNLIQLGLEHGGQVCITCTEPEQAGEDLMKQARHFEVRQGVVSQR